MARKTHSVRYWASAHAFRRARRAQELLQGIQAWERRALESLQQILLVLFRLGRGQSSLKLVLSFDSTSDSCECDGSV